MRESIPWYRLFSLHAPTWASSYSSVTYLPWQIWTINQMGIDHLPQVWSGSFCASGEQQCRPFSGQVSSKATIQGYHKRPPVSLGQLAPGNNAPLRVGLAHSNSTVNDRSRWWAQTTRRNIWHLVYRFFLPRRASAEGLALLHTRRTYHELTHLSPRCIAQLRPTRVEELSPTAHSWQARDT